MSLGLVQTVLKVHKATHMARFPFSAIVAQDEMKQALLIAAVDPSIGGVMVFGDRGTGKSTAARALAGLLPPIMAADGCPYGASKEDQARYPDICGQGKLVKRAVPFVDMPLGATEDRVLGSLDLERALRSGEKAFEPGLLAKAHRGFLYIDEINLLEDHLVDLLLDVAASGENVVEREGLSVRHPAKFVLIGSGNPEEGELRPQLLDRFGLSVEVRTPREIENRIRQHRALMSASRELVDNWQEIGQGVDVLWTPSPSADDLLVQAFELLAGESNTPDLVWAPVDAAAIIKWLSDNLQQFAEEERAHENQGQLFYLGSG